MEYFMKFLIGLEFASLEQCPLVHFGGPPRDRRVADCKGDADAAIAAAAILPCHRRRVPVTSPVESNMNTLALGSVSV